MLKKLVKTYYKLLDEKLENWTVVVIVIALLIVSVSLLINDTNAGLYTKNNILEVNWIKYQIILEDISK